jgi:hypothetical protein
MATMHPSLLLSLLATLAVFAALAVEIVPRQTAASCSIDTLIKAKGKKYSRVAMDQNSLTTGSNAAITGAVGLVLFNFAWNQAGIVSWKVPCTYILRVMGILFFAAFMYFEIYIAQHLLVPINMLSQEAVFALSIVAHGWASFGIWVYYLWQLIENLRHDSVLSSAAQQIPVALSGLAA